MKNKIDSCKIVDDIIAEDSCEQHRGFLIYALIKAESEKQALEKAAALIKQISPA